MKRALAVLVLAIAVILVIYGIRRANDTSRSSGSASVVSGTGAGQPGGAGAGGRSGTAPSLPMQATSALPAATGSKVVIKARWGTGDGEVGARAAMESNPEGPMAIVAGAGGLLMLDQVNARVLRYGPDGKYLGKVGIGPDTAQDVALGPNGKVAVLDRVDQGQVIQYDENGNVIGEAPVVGGPMTEAGGATGVFSTTNGTYVEREHGEIVQILGPGGAPIGDRPTAPGRPLRDGVGFIQALLVDKAGGTATVREFSETGDLNWQRTVRFPASIVSLVLLDSDLAGRVFFAAHIGIEGSAPPFDLTQERIVVVGLAENDGADRGSVALPPPNDTDESMRPLTVGDDGTIYQMLSGPDGVEVRSYQLQ